MKKDSVLLLWLAKRTGKRLGVLLLLTLANAGMALLSVIFALDTKNIVNSAVAGSREDLMEAILLQIAVILGLLFLLALQRYLNSRTQAELDRDWKKHLSRRILCGDYAAVTKLHSGELLNRLNNDVRAVDEGLLTILPGLASMLTRIVAVMAVLFVLEPVFALILLGAGLLMAVATGAARHWLRELNLNVSRAEGKVSGFFQEAFEKLILVQAMHMEQAVTDRGDALMQQRYNLQKRRWRVTLLSNTALSVFVYTCTFAALLWCANGVYQKTMDFGELTAITQLVAQLQAPLVNLSSVLPSYAATLAACQRLKELEDVCGTQMPTEMLPASHEDLLGICARDLSFSYDRDKILTAGDFTLPAGSFTVITGPSGVGKSTLLKLLLGIFSPNCGELQLVTKNGPVPVSRDTRGLFAYVPQGNLLFSGTLRENLLLAKPDATDEEVQRAVYVSCMDDFLPSLPDGLDTLLGENAHGLSEGQAQRLSIARAILLDAPILLLDECTSALDDETERRVLQRICQLPDKTCLAVSHRPEALSLAEYQLTLEEQRITVRK